ncbi:HTH_Tnp_Tc3_2 domain-containing protein [Trichonephila clavipes]|nr:HTH_Tnp_Tc3_2 domain-containing protein [Trichonephila clavipes]
MPLRRNRRQYEQLTDFDRGRIIGLREAGWSNRRIARPRSERYGSCSVLATVDHRRHPVPSRETIRRRLTEVGLRSRRPLRRLPLTPHHRQCRLDFADLGNLECDRLGDVSSSVMNRFSLSADDHRTRVWRRTGQRSDPAFIVERHTAISQGVTVWGSNFLGHTIIFSGPSRHFDSSQIGRYFNADCATHAIKSPRCHLSIG